MSHKFAQSTSLLHTTDLIFLGNLEKVDKKNAEFGNSKIVKVLKNKEISVSHNFAKSTSLLQTMTTDLISFGNVGKADEKNAEFENSNNLNEVNPSVDERPSSLHYNFFL